MKRGLMITGILAVVGIAAYAQTSVTTEHNDIARTGANTNETILTPANVNTTTFGKLFSTNVDGWVYAQPLYMPGVTMGAGTAQPNTTHNVVFVATEHDSVFAFDADSNLGANANPLWQVSLIDAAHGAGPGETTVSPSDLSQSDIVPEIGITTTPVIDPTSNTIYVVAKSTLAGTTFIQRLHALDITTGQEKFGGPVQLSGSVPGNGNGSSGGTLNWDPMWENNRASLLLLNGIVYIGFGSHADNGPWHGWILAYNASTLSQTGVWCATPNGAGAGIWMSGTGLAADVPSGKPYGRIFTATGNGTFDAVAPNYTNSMDYGDSIIKLDLANGVPTMLSGGTTVGDDFTPLDQAALNNVDEDQASGGVVLLPDSVGGGGDQLVQVGKSGIIYVLNREDLGGYNPNNTTDPGTSAYVNGLWGAPAYWNGQVYVWSTNNNLMAFGFANGAFTSSSPSSTSVQSANWPSPTPSISANGTTNGIVWSIVADNYSSQGPAILSAHDASNVATRLYSSETNLTRDNPGNSVKFVVPTVVNGKVYVDTESQLSVYGLLEGATQAATPDISPASNSFNTSVQVTITDGTPGATVYYTTDGSNPSTASTPYTGPFSVTTTTTVNAIAAGTGLLASTVATATYRLVTQVATPTFNPPPGYYVAVQSVTISTTTPNSTIYYTLDGTTPTTNSTQYTGPVSVGVTETLSALAVDNSGVLSNSIIASGLYTVVLGGVSSIDLSAGFTPGTMELLGSAKLNGTALELTDGKGNEAAAAWYQVEANITSFTTHFNFQITPASAGTADGFTFTIQGNNATSIGPNGGGLGYGTPGIGNSVAVKFDLYNNAGEGNDSTGLYTNAASPTVPAVDMTSSGVNLHSGDVFNVQMTYDGTTLTMTITDTTTNATFTTSWVVNIPNTVGGNVAYVGFTGGTGGATATQEILNWTFTSTNAGTPTITSLSPASGAVGTSVVITGTGFGTTQETSTVTFNGTVATPTTWSATSIAVPVPSGATTGNVVVTVGGVASNGVSFTVTPAGAPVITSATTASGTVGTALSYQITATNSPTSYGATGLPAGLSVSSTTGLISGTPTAAGTSTVTLSATNSGGTGNATLTLAIAARAPVITSATTASGIVGAAFSYQITATNSPTSYGATGLPAGLSVSSTTGLISGTPTAAGTSTVTLSATNSGGTGNATLTLTIATVIIVSSVQAVANAASGSASSLSLSFPKNTAAGDLILVAFDYNTNAVPSSVTDSQGNTFTQVGTQLTSPGGARSVVYYANNIKGGADKVTVKLSAKSAWIELYLSEYSGVAQTNPVDAQAGASGSAGAVSSGNATTTAVGDLIYGYCDGDRACTAGSGFTTRSSFHSNLIEDELAGSAGTYAATGTANNGWTMQMVALKPSAVGGAAPAITSATTASGTVGTAFSYQITATNNPTSYGATGLPAGLSVSSTTGLISGTPTAAGTSTVTLSATNSAGTGNATLTLTIAVAVPVITSATTASGTAGTAFSYQIIATNSPTSYGATGLPAGLSVSSTTGLISGTPTTAATSTVTLSATNSAGTGSATLTLTIAVAAPVITSATTASGTVGTAFSYQITATNSPTSYGATGLPAGLSVSSTTGLISGTPTAAGTSTVTLSATNSAGTGNAMLTLTIAVAGAPVITSATTASGKVGTAFSYQITATNSPTSYGATGLPAGLSVSSTTGLISGTPTTAGTSTVTLSATNSGGTGNATLTLTIAAGAPVITSATTASGTAGTAFSYQIIATNSPTSYGATGLPAGLSVSSTTGLISGTPTAAGTSTVTLSATNSSGKGTATLTLAIAVAAPVITSATTASGKVGTAFSYQITATNSPTSYGATGLPAGLSVSSTTGLISGTPTAAGTSTVTLSATNSGGTGNATLTLTIATVIVVSSVQAVANAASGSASSLSLSFPKNTAAGDLILVAFDYNTNAVPSSVTDSQGNTFTQVGTQLTSPGGARSVVYYANNIKGGADTVTVNLSANSAWIELYLSEYSGVAQTNPIDAQAGASGNAGSVSSGNATTTVAGDLIYGYCVGDYACAAGSGFTTRSSFNSNLIEDELAGSAGTYVATGTATNGWTMQMVALKP